MERGLKKERWTYMYVAELMVIAALPSHSLAVVHMSRGERRK
jgi:hypothetical protein